MIGSLIIYSSTDGHTITICKRIIDFLKDGNKAKLVSLDEAKNLNLSEFDKIIIGASIRYGKHSKDLYKFIELNKNILNEKESIFFSVNVVARKPEKNTPDNNPYIKKFLKILYKLVAIILLLFIILMLVLSISSVQKFWKFLLEILKNIPERNS